ncbi:hypothetical protein CR513_49045, partial [Mucuna pruriens]
MGPREFFSQRLDFLRSEDEAQPCPSPRTRQAPIMVKMTIPCNSRLSFEAVRRQKEVEEWQHVVEALRVVEQWENELHQQLATMKVTVERTSQTSNFELTPPTFWGQSFNKEIDRTPVPAHFKELVVDHFDGT